MAVDEEVRRLYDQYQAAESDAESHEITLALLHDADGSECARRFSVIRGGASDLKEREQRASRSERKPTTHDATARW
ncbi:hypothetical protein GRS48_11975 [Halorubrum sp. JWXQ-INN 858]|uniref:hypothetical protein n=1 Tax=Halorubrum sp. JWXQ-INN 858 TaxID=2690782 RepID=UPI001357B385|nr:hypothetical protein [Halorubrum sp. JWXQ-INN 858]MWV65530.1 hypothetical protein [Halorubrum sp. JWXQ-INN 858]